MSEKEKEQPFRVTEEEAREKAHKIAKMAAAHLATHERRWEKSRQTDLGALHGALFLLQAQLPPWLFTGLRRVVEKSMRGPSVDEVRWLMVRQALDHPELRLTWEQAYEYVSEQLQKTDARGAADTVKKSYQKIERSLPPDLRRLVTRRRRHRQGG